MQLLKNLIDGKGVYAGINMIIMFGVMGYAAYRACTKGSDAKDPENSNS
jgi:hypothetical protein